MFFQQIITALSNYVCVISVHILQAVERKIEMLGRS